MRPAACIFTATQDVVLQRGELPQVELTDTKMGRLQCASLVMDHAHNAMSLAGPGRIEVLPSAVRGKDTPITAGTQPIVATWFKSLDIELAKIPGSRAGKTDSIIRRAFFDGSADIRDPGAWWIHADKLDAQLAFAVQDGGRPQQAIEHFLATGNVAALSYHSGTPEAQQIPDSIGGQRLELTTARSPGKALPLPDQLFVDGQVKAIAYQPDKKIPASGSRRRWRPRARWPAWNPSRPPPPRPATAPSTAPATDMMHGLNVRDLLASGGVKSPSTALAIRPSSPPRSPLQADAKANTAVLIGQNAAGDSPAVFAEVERGEDHISGLEIHLDSATQGIAIPGKGEFVFLQQSKKVEGKPAETYPVKITWNESMAFAGKAHTGQFFGGVKAMLVDKPDQSSELQTDRLYVTLAQSAGDAAAATNPAAMAKGLDRLHAEGHVIARGETYDADHNLLTRMLLTRQAADGKFVGVESLMYSEKEKLLTIPGVGSMLVEDHRPQPKAKPGQAEDQQTASARGTTAFSWQDGLTYAGKTGEIRLNKAVTMVYKPLEPLRLNAGRPAAGRGNSASTVSQVTLTCGTLVAIAANSEDHDKQPGGGWAIATTSKFPACAEGWGDRQAELMMDQTLLDGDTLLFDMAKNQARAVAKEHGQARAGSPDLGGYLNADEIIWDLAKDPSKEG